MCFLYVVRFLYVFIYHGILIMRYFREVFVYVFYMVRVMESPVFMVDIELLMKIVVIVTVKIIFKVFFMIVFVMVYALMMDFD
jgi:hypothetical protein